MEAFDNYIKQFPHYSPQVFEMVLPYLKKKKISAGEHLVTEGQVCKSIYFIEEGLFRLYYLTGGKEITNCFCNENNIITSYSSLITETESEIGIQALEDSHVIILPYQALITLYGQDLFWQQVGRLAAESEYIRTECHNRFLTDTTATERYTQVLKNESELLQRVSLNHLATYLQITPETLSRIRKKLTRT